ncbi:uncharacterized protein JCM15063_002531 [Sporobolomyces koalae]|uniref:uncharacterized protein n=1 Tax=Sporobolomyces koalae TaxID=500713 RepID=UPI0031735944
MARDTKRSAATSKTGSQSKRDKEVRLIKIAIAVTSVYMLVELVVGYTFNALVLIADSFHMLNDIVAYIVQLYADEIGAMKRDRDENGSGFTYGFSRTAFVANLINGVILLGLCLTLALESVQRLYSPETMTMPPLVAGLGGLAFCWNIYMSVKFSNAHAHGSNALCHPALFRRRVTEAGILAPRLLVSKSLPHGVAQSSVKEPESALSIHANTDAFLNLAVIFDGLLSVVFGPKIGKVSGLYKHWRGIGFVDPLASLIVTYLILMHSLPLVTASSYALMQAFDPQRTKRVQRVFAGQTWLSAPLQHEYRVRLSDIHIWSMSKDEHVATLKLDVKVSEANASREPTLHDLAEIEDFARQVLAEDNIRKEMM